ncbi:MAG: type III polyketide synthase [Planctomycetaceae bacterium]|nr:type III polyketide synthase [Planctomycetaceae bacterium]
MNRPFRILGLGTALPTHHIVQTEAASFAETCLAGQGGEARRSSTLVQALYRRSGVKTRHSVVLNSSTNGTAATQDFYWPSDTEQDLGPGTAARMLRYETESPLLAHDAASRAMEESGVRADQVTHLVTVSCSGFSAPGFDLSLIDSLGLSPRTARTHVGFMGCHGALNGLRVAAAFASSDPNAVVLVCAVEICTLHHQYGWDPQRIVANSLFADGAAAVVGRAADSKHTSSSDETSESGGHATGPSLAVIAHDCCVIPDTREMMTWRIADHGFQMSLSPEVPDVITRQLAPVLIAFLARHQLTIEQVGSWAVHPGGPRILKAVADVAGLTDEQLAPSLGILERCGNMSSPTVLFIIDELRRRSAPMPCVVMGFGPGLNVEIALINH